MIRLAARGRAALPGRVRAVSLVAALGFACASVVAAASSSGAVTARPHADAFSQSKTITRTHLVDGQDQVAEQRNVTVTVDKTTDLRNLQEIKVSWTGAHPTGGLSSDPNSSGAQGEEYPMVLLECRGVDTDSPAPGQEQLSPQTCWTQAASERFYDDANSAYPPWRLDRYATADERKLIAGAPDPYPSACPAPTNNGTDVESQHWLPFVGSDGSVYAGGQSGCAGQSPEASNYSATLIPSNETFAATSPSGAGTANFDVWTAEQNTSLGCSNDVPCSLVAVPILGISCDAQLTGLPPADRPTGTTATNADNACEANGALAPGSPAGGGTGANVAVTGAFWWSASNWRNRITVPLTFAQAANICDIVSNGDPVDIYGSELMTSAMAQWQPHFCLDPKLFRLKHVQTGEPQAANLLAQGSIDAGFTVDPPAAGYPQPVVSAPTALTGFAIGYQVDGADGEPYATLKLTPRLLAKLLTESYSFNGNLATKYYPYLANNPINMADDPEFEALNPGVAGPIDAVGAATMLFASSDSDLMTALTSYINADPEARAWLDGTPDPWGMVVNKFYKGIQLPVDSWPLLDTTIAANDDQSGNPCLYFNPVPFLPLIEAPVLRYSYVAQNIQFATQNSQIKCSFDPSNPAVGSKLGASGRQFPGRRFIFGLLTLADARRYGIPAAQLETQTAAEAPTKFSDATGRTFVGPSDDSIVAAAKQLVPDDDVHQWVTDYTALRVKAADAYPGTMLVNTVVPTAGLPTTESGQFATFLRFAVTSGQTPGGAAGQLPDGYTPLTGAGLSTFTAYTQQAADAVAAQKGAVPSLSGTAASPSPSASTKPSKHGRGTAGGSTGGRNGSSNPTTTPAAPGSTGEPATGSSSTAVLPGAPAPTIAPAPSASEPVQAVSVSKTVDTPSALGAWTFPIVAIVALAMFGASSLVRRFGRLP